MLNGEILESLRAARDALTDITGIRVRIIGDPDDQEPPSGMFSVPQRCYNIHRISLTGGSGERKLAGHVAWMLNRFVADSLDVVLLERKSPAERVKITFDGYEDDLRELCEIPEVRRWLRSLFIEQAPQALAVLDAETLGLAATCCNDLVRVMKTVGPRGSPAARYYKISLEWRFACFMAGIDPEAI